MSITKSKQDHLDGHQGIYELTWPAHASTTTSYINHLHAGTERRDTTVAEKTTNLTNEH